MSGELTAEEIAAEIRIAMVEAWDDATEDATLPEVAAARIAPLLEAQAATIRRVREILANFDEDSDAGFLLDDLRAALDGDTLEVGK